MTVGFIWHCVYPWDVRLEKIIAACIGDGHRVCLVTKGRADLPRVEEADGVRNVRVVSTRLPGLAGKAATYPLFFNPVWRSTAIRTFRDARVDVIVVRDLPLAGLGLAVGRALRKPVVLDMAENYPAALLAYENPVYKPFLVGNAWLPRQYERWSGKRLDHIFVVADEQAERLRRMGIAADKITEVGNTPVEEFIEASSQPATAPGPSGKINLLYVGKLDIHRGADLPINVLPELRRRFPRLHLTLVGDGKDRPRLESLASACGVADAVSFPGWVPWNRIAEFIRESSVCLIPHRRSEHTDTTLPNKLFDYMAFSKPVIASDCTPLKRVIEKHDCGCVFVSGDGASLAAAVTRTLSDPRLDVKGRNGRMAIEREYRWEIDKARFLDVIRRLGVGANGSAQGAA